MQANESQTGQELRQHVAYLLRSLAPAIARQCVAPTRLEVAPTLPLEPEVGGEGAGDPPAALEALIVRLGSEDPEQRSVEIVRFAHQAAAEGAAPEETIGEVERVLTAARLIIGGLDQPPEELAQLDSVLETEAGPMIGDVWAGHTRWLEERAHETRAQMEALFDHSSDPAILIQTHRGWVREANPATSELTGYSPARLRNMALSDLLPNAGAATVRALWSAVTDEGYAELTDLTLARREGPPVPCSLTATLTRRDGAPAALCFIREAGDQAMSRAALQLRTSELQSAVASQVAEIDQLRTFLENVISALPIRLVVLDSDLRIIHANPAYYVQRGLPKEDVVGRPVDEVFTQEMLETSGLRGSLLSVIETGERVRWSNYRDTTPRHGERVLNVRLDPCEGPDGARTVLVTFEDITERHTQLYERTLLHHISRAMLGELDLDRLLHLILTGMTAGGAVGLGFNRAILMLVDEDAGVLRAQMAVGPETLEQAVSIWAEVSQGHRTLQDFLADYSKLPPPGQQPLAGLVERLVVPLDDTEFLPMAAVMQRKTVHVMDAEMDEHVRTDLAELLGTNEFVVAPLVAREKTIGAAIADTRFSHQPIDHAAVQLLTALADQAALAIDTARTFQRAKRDAEQLDVALKDLEAAQEQQLKSAQLAAIGEVTAIVAHEIRSPLYTIGGFARSIAREPELVERRARNSRIIVDEVMRLEGILGELLDFSKPSESKLVLLDLAPVVRSVANQLEQGDTLSDVVTRVEAPPEAPAILADEKQVRQIIINLANNALQAMPHGGTLTLALETSPSTVDVVVQDTGEGMSPERLSRIFDAFYTTKPTGTGLGLALCQKLAAQHGAQMDVQSQLGEGTRFTVRFPLPHTRAAEGAVGDEQTNG